MNSEQLYDAAVRVLDVLEHQHKAAAPKTTLGAWILSKFYPKTNDTILAGCEDVQKVRALLLTRWQANWLPFGPVQYLDQA